MNCFWLSRALGGKTSAMTALSHSRKFAFMVGPPFNWVAFSKAVFAVPSSSLFARENLAAPKVAFCLVMQRPRRSIKIIHSSGVISLKYTMGISLVVEVVSAGLVWHLFFSILTGFFFWPFQSNGRLDEFDTIAGDDGFLLVLALVWHHYLLR